MKQSLLKLMTLSLVILFSSTTSVAFSATKPQAPDINMEDSKILLNEWVQTALLGDICDIANQIPQSTESYLQLIASQDKEMMQALSDFSQQRRQHYAAQLGKIASIKHCYLNSSETRLLVKDSDRKAEQTLKQLASSIDNYNNQLATWREEQRLERERQQQEQARRERQAEQEQRERIRSKALSLSQQLSEMVVSENYQGGSNIGVNLIDYEYLESSKTMRMKVEIKWNGKISGASGYAADGYITAIYDSLPKWKYGTNVKWSPTWQSSKLNDWIEERQGWGMAGALLGGAILLDSQK